MSESEIYKKLAELNNTQKSIQSTSTYFISLRNDAKNLAKCWYKSFVAAQTHKKLTYIYLVNDILQNGKKTGPEFLKVFQAILPSAFKEAAKVADSSTRQSITRLLKVWTERHVYPSDFLHQLDKIVNKVWSVASTDTSATPEGDATKSSSSRKEHRRHRHKHRETAASEVEPVGDNQPVSPRPKSSGGPAINTKDKSVAPTDNGSSKSAAVPEVAVQREAGTPPNSPPPLKRLRGESMTLREELDLQLQKDSTSPPETAELLKALEDLQNAASADAVVRKKISAFPPNVADVQAVQKIKSKSEGLRLLEEVEACDNVLVEYNDRLEQEMAERKRIALLLRSYLLHQGDRVKQSEVVLEEYKSKLEKATKMRQDLNSHLSKLPDLTLLPDVTSGLDPLPSVGDLFS